MSPAFIPRSSFPISTLTLPKTYFLGHHRAGLNKIKSLIYGGASSGGGNGRKAHRSGPLGTGELVGAFGSVAHGMIDLVIECRDYRVPLSSRNELFEREVFGIDTDDNDGSSQGTGSIKRLIVYTKRDLARESLHHWRTNVPTAQKVLEDELESDILQQTQHSCSASAILFSDLSMRRSIQQILAFIRTHATQRQTESGVLTGSRCLVVGLPNVGKSTLLNALRSAGMAQPQHSSNDENPSLSTLPSGTRIKKAARTGSQPGITRKVSSMVKILDEAAPGTSSSSSSISHRIQAYIADTPGVFTPSPSMSSSSSDTDAIPWNTRMLHLALLGSVKDGLISPVLLADYLLYRLNLHLSSREHYTAFTTDGQPTNDVVTLLDGVARKTGRLKKQNRTKYKRSVATMGRESEVDLDSAALWLLRRYRQGRMGRFVLDDLAHTRNSHQGHLEEAKGEEAVEMTLSQARKKDKELRRMQQLQRQRDRST